MNSQAFKLSKETCNFCSFESISEDCNLDCNNPDLNDFFNSDAVNYIKSLMGKSYCFVSKDDPSSMVCAFTVSNDSLNLRDNNWGKRKVNENISHPKQMRTYPAVKIGRMGVDKKYQGMGVGTQLMDFIKAWFVQPNNKTGCRFIIVDAYNNEQALGYYVKNGFKFLYKTEEAEKSQYALSPDENLRTRMMYFDLMVLVSKEVETTVIRV